MTIRLAVRARDADAPTSRSASALFNADGICCYGTNTWVEELAGRRFEGTGEVRFVIDGLDLDRRHLQDGRRGTLAATAIRTTTTACSTPSA